MFEQIGLYYRTVRYLTPRQLVYQLWNRLRGRPRLRPRTGQVPDDIPRLTFPVTLTFLHQSVTFDSAIDWNYTANGKLWTYNLNYFDWLNGADDIAFIYDFIRQTPHLTTGLEPYPTSLRVMNWCRFLRQHQIQNPLIETHLRAQTALLRSRLEYHLGGNHLLENACALLIVAVHLEEWSWFEEAAQLLRKELAEQILSDGGHYELSPVYHQLLTDHLLDVYGVLRETTSLPDPTLPALVEEKVAQMLGWLQAVTFRNGDVPMVNDAAYEVAPTTAQLLAKAGRLKILPKSQPLGESGYRMLTTPRLECFVDVGPVGPDHQPGHAHADTLSFLLHVDNQPVLVDVGTSTYEVGERRNWERSTAAHNTVTIDNLNSSEVWGGFRVGQRAKVSLIADTAEVVTARHDGFFHYLPCSHERQWKVTGPDTIELTDLLTDGFVYGQQHFYLSEDEPLFVFKDGVDAGKVQFRFVSDGPTKVRLDTYKRPVAFNAGRPASCFTVTFSRRLTTVISIAR